MCGYSELQPTDLPTLSGFTTEQYQLMLSAQVTIREEAEDNIRRVKGRSPEGLELIAMFEVDVSNSILIESKIAEAIMKNLK